MKTDKFETVASLLVPFVQDTVDSIRRDTGFDKPLSPEGDNAAETIAFAVTEGGPGYLERTLIDIGVAPSLAAYYGALSADDIISALSEPDNPTLEDVSTLVTLFVSTNGLGKWLASVYNGGAVYSELIDFLDDCCVECDDVVLWPNELRDFLESHYDADLSISLAKAGNKTELANVRAMLIDYSRSLAA